MGTYFYRFSICTCRSMYPVGYAILIWNHAVQTIPHFCLPCVQSHIKNSDHSGQVKIAINDYMFSRISKIQKKIYRKCEFRCPAYIYNPFCQHNAPKHTCNRNIACIVASCQTLKCVGGFHCVVKFKALNYIPTFAICLSI